MDTYFSLIFWKRTLERAIKSAAGGVLVVLGLGMAAGSAGQAQVNAWLIDWSAVTGGALGAAFVSVVLSVASAKIGPTDNPSLV